MMKSVNEMSTACSTHGRDVEGIQNSSRWTWRKERTWENKV